VLLGQPVARREGPTHIAFSPDGKRIVTSNDDTTVRIWDARSGEELYKSERQIEHVFSSTFFPDGMRIATVNGDRSVVRIWRAPR
jgi:WD40 repeat protein